MSRPTCAEIRWVRNTPPGRYRRPVIGAVPLVLYRLGLFGLAWRLDRKMPMWVGRKFRRRSTPWSWDRPRPVSEAEALRTTTGLGGSPWV
jgi:hypothetical protein